MQLDQDGDRSNVEDRRGSRLGGHGVKLGIGGTLLVLALSVVFKQDLFTLLDASSGPGGASMPAGQVEQRQAAEAGLEKIAVGAFNDSQRVWGQTLKGYRPAKLV